MWAGVGGGFADVLVTPCAVAQGGGGVEPLMTFPMLQPCDISVTYDQTAANPTGSQQRGLSKPTAQGSVTTTDLVLSLSPAVMQLVMRTSVQLQMTLGRSAPPTVRTQRYVLLHSGCKEYLKGNAAARETVETLPSASAAGLAFWRPAPMAGYVSVGDLVTCGGAFRPPPRPLRPALLLRDSVALVWPPVAYNRVWCDPAAGIGLWEPVAPEGFVAMGCVAGGVDDPPPLNLVRFVPLVQTPNPLSSVSVSLFGGCRELSVFYFSLYRLLQSAVSPSRALTPTLTPNSGALRAPQATVAVRHLLLRAGRRRAPAAAGQLLPLVPGGAHGSSRGHAGCHQGSGGADGYVTIARRGT